MEKEDRRDERRYNFFLCTFRYYFVGIVNSGINLSRQTSLTLLTDPASRASAQKRPPRGGMVITTPSPPNDDVQLLPPLLLLTPMLTQRLRNPVHFHSHTECQNGGIPKRELPKGELFQGLKPCYYITSWQLRALHLFSSARKKYSQLQLPHGAIFQMEYVIFSSIKDLSEPHFMI